MKRRAIIIATLAGAFGSVGAAADEELKSGIEVGERIGSYTATKHGGIDDGVRVGQKLCYT